MPDDAGTTELSVWFDVTADDLVAASRTAGRHALPWVYAAAVWIGAAGVYFWGSSPRTGAIVIGIAVLVAAVTFFPWAWRLVMRRRGRSLIGERRRFVLDAEGMHEERAGVRHTTPWQSVTEVRVDRGNVAVLQNGYMLHLLPARAFRPPVTLTEFLALVGQHAPRAWVH